MKKNTSKKMRNYSAMSAAILASAVASGQVVFTEVADELFAPGDANGGQANLDLNDDGTVDFTITIAESAGGLSFVARPSDEAIALNGGAFVGMPAGNYQYPQLLSDGDDINTGSAFTDAGVRGDLNFYGCAYDNSAFCGTLADVYLGLVFDFEGNSHYGWAHMDIDTEATTGTFTLKGFAFDATPEADVVVGDQGELNTADQNLIGFTHFVDANSFLTISNRVEMNNITIFDISGKQVISQNINQSDARINLSSLNNGVYIGKVTIEGAEKSFKFVR